MQRRSSSQNKKFSKNNLSKISKKRRKKTNYKIKTDNQKQKKSEFEIEPLEVNFFEFATKKIDQKKDNIFQKSFLESPAYKKKEKLEILTNLNSKKIEELKLLRYGYIRLINKLKAKFSDLSTNLNEKIQIKIDIKLKKRRCLHKRKKSLRDNSCDDSKITQDMYNNKLMQKNKVKILFKKSNLNKKLNSEHEEVLNVIEFKQKELEEDYQIDIKEQVGSVNEIGEKKKKNFEKKIIFMKNLEFDYFKLKELPLNFFVLRLYSENNFFELNKKFIVKKKKVKINPKFLNNSSKNIFKFESNFLIYLEKKKIDVFEKELKENLAIYFYNHFVANFKKNKNLIRFNSEKKRFNLNFDYSLKANIKEINLVFIFQKNDFIKIILKIIFNQISKIILNSNIFKNSQNNIEKHKSKKNSEKNISSEKNSNIFKKSEKNLKENISSKKNSIILKNFENKSNQNSKSKYISNTFKNSENKDQNNNSIFFSNSKNDFNQKINQSIRLNESSENLEIEDILNLLKNRNELSIYLNFSLKTLIKEISKKVHFKIIIRKNNFGNFKNQFGFNSLIFVEEDFYINEKDENVINKEIKLTQKKLEFLNNLF